MLRTGIDFAPNTTAACKRQVAMLPPDAILDAYREARKTCGTSDIVLHVHDQSPDISGGTREAFKAHLRRVFGPRAQEFKMYSESAHAHMRLPQEAEAMWFVVEVSGADVPIMCVLFAHTFKTEPVSN